MSTKTISRVFRASDEIELNYTAKSPGSRVEVLVIMYHCFAGGNVRLNTCTNSVTSEIDRYLSYDYSVGTVILSGDFVANAYGSETTVVVAVPSKMTFSHCVCFVTEINIGD